MLRRCGTGARHPLLSENIRAIFRVRGDGGADLLQGSPQRGGNRHIPRMEAPLAGKRIAKAAERLERARRKKPGPQA